MTTWINTHKALHLHSKNEANVHCKRVVPSTQLYPYHLFQEDHSGSYYFRYLRATTSFYRENEHHYYTQHNVHVTKQ